MDEIKKLLDQLETAINNKQKATVQSLIEKFQEIDTFDEPIPAELNRRAEMLSEKAFNLLN